LARRKRCQDERRRTSEASYRENEFTQLLLGFIEPDCGSILVNGEPLNKIPLDEWRRQITWVPQQATLFQDTILANLLIANPDADMHAVEESARKAEIFDLIISLPEGFLTRVGEGGARFSGGERNRLALARAFLRKSAMVILDEPTAQLDTALENRLEAAIRVLCKGKTVLLIGHRMNTIRKADRVVALSGGRLEAVVTPGEYFKSYQTGLSIRPFEEGSG